MGVFNLRIDDELHEKIKFIADQQSRSQNKQVEFLIRQYVAEYEKINGKIEAGSTPKYIFQNSVKKS